MRTLWASADDSLRSRRLSTKEIPDSPAGCHGIEASFPA